MTAALAGPAAIRRSTLKADRLLERRSVLPFMRPVARLPLQRLAADGAGGLFGNPILPFRQHAAVDQGIIANIRTDHLAVARPEAEAAICQECRPILILPMPPSGLGAASGRRRIGAVRA